METVEGHCVHSEDLVTVIKSQTLPNSKNLQGKSDFLKLVTVVEPS